MANTIDIIGDNALIDQIISRTITEIEDDTLLSVGSTAFSSCSSLTSVKLTAATSIDGSAFNGCSNLTSIKLPATTSIGSSAFGSCTKLADIYLPNDASSYSRAPWGATNATIHYNYDFSQDGGE